MEKIIFDNYLISSEGFLFSLRTNKTIGTHDTVNERVYVKIRINGKRKQFYIAELVAQNFMKLKVNMLMSNCLYHNSQKINI